jgi:chorismate dehydratase
MESHRSIRIGAVSYLNTRPLVHGLSQRLPEASLTFDLPSRLADQLAHGSLDVALIPSFEFLRGNDYELVSDAAIACRGPVWSVRLLSRVPIHSIRSLALDEGSRTSAALAQVLLWDMYQLRPRLLPLPIDADWESIAADAVLIIGDRAMHPPAGLYHEIWDLGDRWCRAHELPFVFAVWAGRRGQVGNHVAQALAAARDDGLNDIEQIAQSQAGRHGLTVDDCMAYFTRHLQFRLQPEHLRGMQRYAEKCVALQLLSPAALSHAATNANHSSAIPHTPTSTAT